MSEAKVAPARHDNLRRVVQAAGLVHTDPDKFEREQARAKQDKSVSQLKVATLVIGFFGMALSISAAEMHVDEGYSASPAVYGLKAISSAFTCLLLVLLVLLYRAQLVAGKLHGELDSADTLYSTGMLNSLLLEMCLCALHCPVGLDSTVTFTNLGLTIRYTLDEVFGVLVLVRCYLLVRVFDDAAGFVTAQARVVAKWNRVNFGIGFTFRSMMERFPLRFVSLLMFVTTLSLAHALRVCERPVCRDWSNVVARCGPYEDSYEHYTTALWNIVITMTTVGYGDIYPISHGGRMVATIACFAGVALVALLVTAITGMSQFDPDELRAFNALYRAQGRSSHRSAAARMIASAWAYYKLRLRTIHGLDTRLRFPTERRMRKPTAAALEKDVVYVTNADGRVARVPNGYQFLLAEVHTWKQARSEHHAVTREKSELALVVAEVLQSRARFNEMSQALARQLAMLAAIVPNLKAQLDLVSAKVGVPRLPLPSTVLTDPGLLPGGLKFPARLVYAPTAAAAQATTWPRKPGTGPEIFPLAYVSMHDAVTSEAERQFSETLRSLPSMRGQPSGGTPPISRASRSAPRLERRPGLIHAEEEDDGDLRTHTSVASSALTSDSGGHVTPPLRGPGSHATPVAAVVGVVSRPPRDSKPTVTTD